MARSTRNVPATPEIPATPATLATASNRGPVDNAEIEAIDWHNETAVAAFMAKQGGNLTPAGMWQNYATGFFMLGRMARQDKQNAVPDAVIDNAFNAYRQAKNKVSKADMPDTTAASHKSAAKGVAEAARRWPHDTTHFLTYIRSEIGSLAWGSRGKRAEDVATAFAKVEPQNVEAIKTAFPAEETVANVMDEATRVRDGVAAWLGGDMAKAINASADVTAAYIALVASTKAMVAACTKAGINPTPKKPRGKKELSADAKAIMAKMAQPAETPTTH